MSDDTHEIKIKITTVADTSGAKEALSAIKQASEAAPETAGKGIAEKGYFRDIGVGVFLTLLIEAAYYKFKEAINELGGRSTPELEGLGEAAERQKEAEEKAELAARAYERKLRRASGAEEGSFEVPDDLREKQEISKKAAGAAAFAAAELAADQADLKKTREKLQQLREEHEELEHDTTGWGTMSTLKPQFMLNRIKKQNEEEQAALEHIAEQQEQRIAQDRAKKFKTADAANAADEELGISEKSWLKHPPAPSGRATPPWSPPPADRNFGEPDAPHINLGNRSPAETFAHSLTAEDLDAAGKALEALEHGRKIDTNQKALIDSLAQLLQTTHSSSKEILDIIRAGHQGQEGLQKEIAEIKKAVAELNRRPPTGTQF